ncbi:MULTISPECIES: sterol carrier family protein [unclassified Corynebacterium]|uniref:sterol carrier family protein n=1 Tax=unclassified Corynebacterium TaxID=2624378 RepID=UPI0029C9FD44|nr:MULTISPECIES: sterol carrier family protein [unclassified Corynebacterium]WPF65761.1 sterol carrier family protein [Corynebacterium sp. 22KM0430]WPF68255.1 sterol carrier family protein [Corynebacterium sp. 21KM1197]
MAKKVDPLAARRAVEAVQRWVRDPEGVDKPPRAEVAAAVRQSARLLEQSAPGHSVEVRVPPFVAVQCIEGPRHTRGTPPNVVEMNALTWLRLALGEVEYPQACAEGAVEASGARAGEVAGWLPLFRLGGSR